MNEFYSILTAKGLLKIAALTNGSTISLTHMVIGDGEENNPDENATSLVNEVHFVELTKLIIDNESQNTIIAEAVITGDVGGFWIREIGLMDSDGDLFAIGKYPATYKPVVEEGSVKEICIRMVLRVTNANNVIISYDGGIIQGANTDLDNLTFIGQKKFDDKAPIESPKFTGHPTTPTPNITDKSERIATSEFVRMTVPVGIVCSAPFSTMNGYLLCDGSGVPEGLDDLNNKLNGMFGLDENNRSRVPDYRGCFLRGLGGNSALDFAIKQNDATPNITGTFRVRNSSNLQGNIITGEIGSAIYSDTSTSGGYSTFAGDSSSTAGTKRGILDASRSSAAYGRDGTTEVRPKNYAVNFFIKY